MWVDLAEGQRQYGSHLLAEPNRDHIREAAVRGIVTDSLLVARDGDDETVGFVTFTVESGVYEQDVLRGLVENVYVVPERRGEGVGAALLSAAEERLGERGCDVIYLEVLATNADARRFYRRHGYEPHRVQLERAADAGQDTATGTENDTTPDAENDTHTRDD